MKKTRLRLPLVMTLLIGVATALSLASHRVRAATAAPAAASAPALAPSAPERAKPEKRLATPQEQRDSATAPGELRTEVQATPQLNIPLRSSGGSGKATYVPPARGKAAPSGGVDDSAARCRAMSDKKAQQDCLDKLR